MFKGQHVSLFASFLFIAVHFIIFSFAYFMDDIIET